MINRFVQLVIAVVVLVLLSGCTTDLWTRIAFSYPPERLGVDVSLGYSAPGLYDELLSIKFNRPFKGVTDGQLPLEVVNMYTTAVKEDGKGYSGFYDPQSRYKDSWFTVMIIQDDPISRSWLLEDPHDLQSIRVEGKAAMVMADQAIIYSLSRRGVEEEPRWTFYDRLSSVHGITDLGEIVHPDGTKWKGIEAVLRTRSALTDPELSRMSRWLSLRFYTGEPDEDILAQVSPWHPVELPGRMYARHDEAGVFILVFFNGSRFHTRDGDYVDTWTEDLIEDYERMFRELQIRRVQ